MSWKSWVGTSTIAYTMARWQSPPAGNSAPQVFAWVPAPRLSTCWKAWVVRKWRLPETQNHPMYSEMYCEMAELGSSSRVPSDIQLGSQGIVAIGCLILPRRSSYWRDKGLQLDVSQSHFCCTHQICHLPALRSHVSRDGAASAAG